MVTILALLFLLDHPAAPVTAQLPQMEVVRTKLVSMLGGSKKLVVHTADGRRLDMCFLPVKSSGFEGAAQYGGAGAQAGWKSDTGITARTHDALATEFVDCVRTVSAGNLTFIRALADELTSVTNELEKLVQAQSQDDDFIAYQTELNVVHRVRSEVVDKALKELGSQVTDVKTQSAGIETRLTLLQNALGKLEPEVIGLGMRLRNVEVRVEKIGQDGQSYHDRLVKVEQTVQVHGNRLDKLEASNAQTDSTSVVTLP